MSKHQERIEHYKDGAGELTKDVFLSDKDVTFHFHKIYAENECM